jgi:RecB family exonuclease
MLIDHLSVSRRKTFRQCAACYRFRYHLKTPRPGIEPEYFVYGKLVHRVAEIYVQKQGKQSIGEIAQEVMRGKVLIDENVSVIPRLSPEYIRKLPKHLRSIQKLTEQIGFDGEVEWPFEYDLDPPNKKLLVGFLDRLIVRKDKAYIIDYKTTKKGKWRTNKSTVLQDEQLKIYARMVQKFFNIRPENIKASLFFMEGEELVAASFTDVSLALLEADYKEEFETIESADPNKVWGNVGNHCKYCDYRTICHFYKPMSLKAEAWDGTMESL